MNRSIALAALAAAALVPATAEARGSKVYRGSFTLVGADGDYVTGKFGKVQLVDGKRNNKLSVHVRRLAARTTYVYRLQEGSCREGAPGGTDVAGWKYRRLKTNRARIGNATARSRTFRARRGTSYAVVVYSGDQVLLCAQLRTKRASHRGSGDKAKGDDKRGKSEEKARGRSDEAPGHAEDKARGRSDEAPGHAEDKARGRSEDAPGHAEDKPRGNSEGKPDSRRGR